VCIIVKNTKTNHRDNSNIANEGNYDMSAILEGTSGMNEANHTNEEDRNDPSNGSSARFDDISVNIEENNQTEVVQSDVNSGEVDTFDGTVGNNESVSKNGNREDDGNYANNNMSALDRLGSMTSLRTLILCGSKLRKGFLAYILERLTLLRVLDLHKTEIEVLPNTIGRLEHLRYLNISDTQIKRVPGTIKSLRMLQYLLLKNCKLKRFPKEIELLRNLRSIDISGTGLCWSSALRRDNGEQRRTELRWGSMVNSLFRRSPARNLVRNRRTSSHSSSPNRSLDELSHTRDEFVSAGGRR